MNTEYIPTITTVETAMKFLDSRMAEIGDGFHPDTNFSATPGRVDWLDSYWHQCRDGKARRVPL